MPIDYPTAITIVGCTLAGVECVVRLSKKESKCGLHDEVVANLKGQQTDFADWLRRVEAKIDAAIKEKSI